MAAHGRHKLAGRRAVGVAYCRHCGYDTELAAIHGRLVRKKKALRGSSPAAEKIRITTRSATPPEQASWTAQLIDGLLREVSPHTRKVVTAALMPPAAGTSLDSELWGDEPTQQQVAVGHIDNLRKQFESRRALEQSSLSRAEVAALLGTSQQAVTDMLAAHHLAGLKQGRRWFIPSWQLDVESERGVIPGLDKLYSAFPGGVVALSEWVNRPSADLGDRTPRQVLTAGNTDAVVELATQLTSAGW